VLSRDFGDFFGFSEEEGEEASAALPVFASTCIMACVPL
jgi:hypothetical protein